jgi:hypothetical protein
MNTTKPAGNANADKKRKAEFRPQSETTTTQTERLIREQRDIARITTYGRRDE